MSLRISNLTSRIVLGFAGILATAGGQNDKTAEAQRNVQNSQSILPVVTSSLFALDDTIQEKGEPKASNKIPFFTEEEKEYVRKNFFYPEAANGARDPRYRVDRKDIDLAMSEYARSSPFALGLTQNPSFPITNGARKFARENFNSAFAQGLVMNSRYTVQEGDVKIARENSDSTFAYYLAQKPDYKIEKDDKEIAWKSPRSKFADGIVQNPNYKVEAKDKEVARSDPRSNFADELAKKEDYKIDNEDKKVARDKRYRDTYYVWYLVQKPDYIVEPTDIEIATNPENFDTMFSEGIATNSSWKVEESEKDFLYANANTLFAQGRALNPTYVVTEKDRKFLRENPNTMFAEGLTKNPSFKILESDIEFALRKENLNTWFSAGLAQHQEFPLGKYWDFVKENFYTRFAFGYAQNPKLVITDEVYNFCDSKPKSAFMSGLFQHPNYDEAKNRIYQDFIKSVLGIKGKPGEVTETSNSSFENDALKSNIPVLVDFHAPWCSACGVLSPLLEELARDYGGQLKVIKINTDENEEIANKYNIEILPTLIFLKGGKQVETRVGTQERSNLAKLIEKHTASVP